MAASSPASAETSSKRLQAGLQLVSKCLSGTSLDVLGKSIEKDDSQTSRIRSNQLGATVKDVVKLLYASGLKCVPEDRVCVDRATYEAINTLAQRAMQNPDIARQLTWDEES